MPALVSPTTRVHASFLEAMAEFLAEGRGGFYDHSGLGRDSRTHASSWGTPSGFESYVTDLLAEALEESPRPAGYVPQTTLWWVEDDTYLGRVGIRHRLTPALLEVGGHISVMTSGRPRVAAATRRRCCRRRSRWHTRSASTQP